MLSFTQALNTVKEKLIAAGSTPAVVTVPLREALGRVLAQDVAADRDYPPFNRSIRDGFAVRSEDVQQVPANLVCRGEIRAGSYFDGVMGKGECVSIMTGGPLPQGADAVVMVEHSESAGNNVKILRTVKAAEHVVRQGSEAAAGACVLSRGRRLGASELGLLATVGKSNVPVYTRPRVAILPTGDEVVAVEQRPEWFQIRNSNATSLAAQVTAAGGVPFSLDVAPDRPEDLRALIEEGLKSDLLLLTGGVSVGKYDFVEQVLADLGAEFYFESVALRPGKPLVFGRVGKKFFFGLPGNPISTFVTFALFARPAIGVLAGRDFEPPLFLRACLTRAVQTGTGLTAFLPARVENALGSPVVTAVSWQGSGDLVGVAAANCFIVIHPEQARLEAGDWVDVMMKEQ